MPFLLILTLFISACLSIEAGAVEYRYPALKQITPAQDLPESSETYIERLVIYSTTDNSAMKEVLQDFQKFYPYAAITYHELQSLEVFKRVQRDGKGFGADVVISSAMDLQMKLVNDGYAMPIDLKLDNPLPKWAVWRNEAYGTTFEPAVIIYNKPYFKDRVVPRTRAELVSFLETKPDGLYGKLATYDIEKSGLGYLFLSRDDSQYSATWDLMRALGENGVKRVAQSTLIIDGVSTGLYKIGYNVLGTYAVSKLKDNPDLGVVLLEDYTTAITRLSFVPKPASSKQAGIAFMEYMLSERGQKRIAQKAGLNAIHANVKSGHKNLNDLRDDDRSIRPIKVSPGLLVYLDQMKKQKMIERWRKALGL